LWYAHEGCDIFKKLSKIQRPVSLPKQKSNLKSRYDIKKVTLQAGANEAGIWNRLIHGLKSVSPEKYEALAGNLPSAYPLKIAGSSKTGRKSGKKR
jgi:hypothetical protein